MGVYNFTKDVESWNINNSYSVGTTVEYDNKIYRANKDVPKNINIGFTEYWEELIENETIINSLTDLDSRVDALEQQVGLHHYSEEEHIIGTWIDDSDIYEKTWVLEEELTITPNTWTNTSIEVAEFGIDKIIGISVLNESGSCFNYISANTDQTYVQVLQTRNNNIAVQYITIQYTKTSE